MNNYNYRLSNYIIEIQLISMLDNNGGFPASLRSVNSTVTRDIKSQNNNLSTMHSSARPFVLKILLN